MPPATIYYLMTSRICWGRSTYHKSVIMVNKTIHSFAQSRLGIRLSRRSYTLRSVCPTSIRQFIHSEEHLCCIKVIQTTATLSNIVIISITISSHAVEERQSPRLRPVKLRIILHVLHYRLCHQTRHIIQYSLSVCRLVALGIINGKTICCGIPVKRIHSRFRHPL